MRAVLTVVGKDGVGILSKISTKCASYNANIVDVNQTIMQDMFCMIMLVRIDDLHISYVEFVDVMEQYGSSMGMKIHVMHEDIFQAMHTI